MNVLDRFRLDGRVALVTGGARGLGRVMAEALVSAGASVVITARDAAIAVDAAEHMAGSAVGVGADVTKPSDISILIERTLEAYGRIDILVNNAGINIRGPIEQLQEEDWDLVLDTNLKGPWLCCKAVAGHMKRQQWGRVINVSSMLGEISLPGRSPYASSKGGLNMLTKTLALEWAADGITVNALCPGPFATEINTPLLKDPVVNATMTSKIPLGRWGEPAEIGPVVVFMASEASSFMTGATLLVDGGYTAQ